MSDVDFKAMYQAMLAVLPKTDPGNGYSLWNNNGIVTRSVKS